MVNLASKPYNIYFGYNNNAKGMYLPVMPEKVEITRKGDGKTYDVMGLGQVNIIKAGELAKISFESFFPDKKNKYSFLSSEVLENPASWKSPEEYIKDLREWMASKHPIRFIYTGPNLLINLAVSIEQFDLSEIAGSGGDIGYEMTLKEYVFYSAKKITAVEKDGQTVLKTEPPMRPDERVPPTTYTLQPGDNLLKVSRRMLGDSGRWREIQKLNGIKEHELKSLQVGMVLKLPPRR